MDQFLIFIAGWLIAYLYYRLSSTKLPEWAKEIVKRLPERQPSEEELLKLFQENLDSGDIEVNQLLGRVAYPNCGASAKNFEEKVFGDDSVTIVALTCPACGWSENVQA